MYRAVTGMGPPPPFPLNERNRGEQRTRPTGIPADTGRRFRQREITGDILPGKGSGARRSIDKSLYICYGKIKQ